MPTRHVRAMLERDAWVSMLCCWPRFLLASSPPEPPGRPAAARDARAGMAARTGPGRLKENGSGPASPLGDCRCCRRTEKERGRWRHRRRRGRHPRSPGLRRPARREGDPHAAWPVAFLSRPGGRTVAVRAVWPGSAVSAAGHDPAGPVARLAGRAAADQSAPRPARRPGHAGDVPGGRTEFERCPAASDGRNADGASGAGGRVDASPSGK